MKKTARLATTSSRRCARASVFWAHCSPSAVRPSCRSPADARSRRHRYLRAGLDDEADLDRRRDRRRSRHPADHHPDRRRAPADRQSHDHRYPCAGPGDGRADHRQVEQCGCCEDRPRNAGAGALGHVCASRARPGAAGGLSARRARSPVAGPDLGPDRTGDDGLRLRRVGLAAAADPRLPRVRARRRPARGDPAAHRPGARRGARDAAFHRTGDAPDPRACGRPGRHRAAGAGRRLPGRRQDRHCAQGAARWQRLRQRLRRIVRRFRTGIRAAGRGRRDDRRARTGPHLRRRRRSACVQPGRRCGAAHAAGRTRRASATRAGGPRAGGPRASSARATLPDCGE